MQMSLVTALVILSGTFAELSAQEERTAVTVTRSGYGDIVRVIFSGGSCNDTSCALNSSTYLVEERECKNDITLQKSE